MRLSRLRYRDVGSSGASGPPPGGAAGPWEAADAREKPILLGGNEAGGHNRVCPGSTTGWQNMMQQTRLILPLLEMVQESPGRLAGGADVQPGPVGMERHGEVSRRVCRPC